MIERHWFSVGSNKKDLRLQVFFVVVAISQLQRNVYSLNAEHDAFGFVIVLFTLQEPIAEL